MELSDREWLTGLLKQAGTVAMSSYMGQFEVFTKPDGSVVTAIDLEINKLITEQIRRRYPNQPVLSEESVDDPDRLQAEIVWIVDPIDGTASFVRNSSEFGILIGRCWKGISHESAAYFPALDLMVYACRGKGCYVNGRGVRVSATPFEQARICTNCSTFHRFATVAPVYRLAALEIVQLCLGEIDGCILDASRAGEHDYAWAPCVIEEAGGCISDVRGEPLRFNKIKRTVPPVIVAGNPVVHARLLTEIQSVVSGKV